MSNPPVVDDAIVPDNLRAMAVFYYAHLLEQMRAFQVVEHLVELYQQGILPLGTGAAANHLRRYAQAGDRLTEHERADLYARTLGVPGTPSTASAGEAQPNREFCALWLRFVSSVALYAWPSRERALLALSSSANAVVCKAARALAVNASANSAGLTSAARRLQADVQAQIELLSEPSIRKAFGARDMWQVIDQVNTNELGGAINGARYRTQAQAGSTILNWLAEHAGALSSGQGATGDVTPSNADLLVAVNEWLATSGVQDTHIEQFAQPRESESAATQSIDLPAIVQDLLRLVGVTEADGSGAAAAPPLAGSVLFYGPAGTGKMLAVYALAEALGVGVVRIDLSRVVSKFIGQAERNIDALFADAEAKGAILLLDEADVLFGKRSEVNDAHDRYGNIETAYLLQRIEAYNGLLILASNAPPQIEDDLPDERWRRVLRRRVRFALAKPE
jgi:hypothetical protein